MIGTSVFVGTNNVKRSGKTFLLDQSFASGATAAYALRLLREKHQGGLIRTRADSSGTDKGEADVLPELQPDGSKIITLNSLIENLNSTAQNRLGTNAGGGNNTLADLVETGTNNFNGFIPTWYEQTPNLNHASNSTASEQPQIVKSGSVIKENGKPAIQSDGSDDLLISPIINIAQPNTYFVVCSYNGNGFGHIIDGSANGRRNLIQFKDTETLFFAGTKFSPTPGFTGQLLTFALFNGASSEFIINNNSKKTGDPGGKSLNQAKIFEGKAGTRNFKGNAQEIIIYDSFGGNVNKVRNEINNHYTIF